MISGLIYLWLARSLSYLAYGETLGLLWTYDLPVSRSRLPGLLATLDGRPIAVGKELTSRRWLTSGTGEKEKEMVEIE